MKLKQVHQAIRDDKSVVLANYWQQNPEAVNAVPCFSSGLLMRTPLQIAITFGKFDIAHLCLTIPGIDVNAVSKDGQTALSLAIKNNCGPIVQALLAAGATLVLGSSSALIYAVQQEAYSMINLLKTSGKELHLHRTFEGLTALAIAVDNKDLKMVELLGTLPGINPNVSIPKYENNNLLHSAIRNLGIEMDVNNNDSYCKMIELLLKIPGIDVNAVNAKGQSAFAVALDLNKSNALPLLINAPGFKLPPYEKRDLYKKLIALPNKEIVITLLKQAIDPLTVLGARFWSKEGVFPCTLNKNTLALICAELKRLDPTFEPNPPTIKVGIFKDLDGVELREVDNVKLEDWANDFGM